MRANFNLTMRAILPCVLALGLALSGARAQAEGPRILTMGDSLMAMHGLTGRSVPQQLQRLARAQVTDRSVPGARMLYALPVSGAMGMSIPAQFRGGGWDWVVMNGGGNDLWLGCGCTRCARKMNRLISQDGTRGALPQLFAKVQGSGARLLYVGYLRSPGIDTPIEHCKAAGDELEARVARLAERVDGLYYVSLKDLVPAGDLSFFALDRIHPSAKASGEIAARIAAVLGAVDLARR